MCAGIKMLLLFLQWDLSWWWKN